jgi:hypothetical protein
VRGEGWEGDKKQKSKVSCGLNTCPVDDVGLSAAWLIAAKFEEIYPASARDITFMAANAFTKEQLLQKELEMMALLQYRVYVPTSYTFLAYFQYAVGVDDTASHLSAYYAERMLQEHSMLGFPPHKVAACALALAVEDSHSPRSECLVRE